MFLLINKRIIPNICTAFNQNVITNIKVFYGIYAIINQSIITRIIMIKIK